MTSNFTNLPTCPLILGELFQLSSNFLLMGPNVNKKYQSPKSNIKTYKLQLWLRERRNFYGKNVSWHSVLLFVFLIFRKDNCQLRKIYVNKNRSCKYKRRILMKEHLHYIFLLIILLIIHLSVNITISHIVYDFL